MTKHCLFHKKIKKKASVNADAFSVGLKTYYLNVNLIGRL